MRVFCQKKLHQRPFDWIQKLMEINSWRRRSIGIGGCAYFSISHAHDMTSFYIYGVYGWFVCACLMSVCVLKHSDFASMNIDGWKYIKFIRQVKWWNLNKNYFRLYLPLVCKSFGFCTICTRFLHFTYSLRGGGGKIFFGGFFFLS